MSQRRILVLATAVVLSAVPLFQAQKAQPNSSADLPPGPMQQKASDACLACHDAHIIVQQRLSKAAWTKEVDKMTKWGASVDAQDRDALIEYLSSNFGVDRAPYQAQRSAPSKSKK